MPTKKEIRLINLKQLVDQYPDAKAFAKTVDIRSPGQLSLMLKGERNITNNMAAKIIKALELEEGYFDQLHQPIEKILDDPDNQELVKVLLAPYSMPLIYWHDIDAWLKFSAKKRAGGFPAVVAR